MENNLLTAQQAKKIVEETYTDDISKIMELIKVQAKKGKTTLHLYYPVKEKTLKQLKELGFDIPPLSSIATQKDGLYHTINW